MIELKESIASWDGKTVALLESTYTRWHANEQFVPTLLELITMPAMQSGATWLLKKHLETGGSITESQRNDLLNALGELGRWDAKLHLLQSLPYLTIPELFTRPLEQFFVECLSEKNKFVRAWAFNGYYELAKQHPVYEDQVMGMLYEVMASDSEPASVKARVRKIIKKGFA